MDIKQSVKEWTDSDLLMEFEEVLKELGGVYNQKTQDDYEVIRAEIFERMAIKQ